MPGCRFWKDQADGFHVWCEHPEAQPGTPCVLNTGDECVLREEFAVCSECGRRVDISSTPEDEYYICEVCASTVTVKPGAGVVPYAVLPCPWRNMRQVECIICGDDSEDR